MFASKDRHHTNTKMQLHTNNRMMSQWPRRRSRSYCLSPLPHSTIIDQSCLTSIKANNYVLLLLQNVLWEDPASFNIEKLCWIRDREPCHFIRFNFMHLSNHIIKTIVLLNNEAEPIINFPIMSGETWRIWESLVGCWKLQGIRNDKKRMSCCEMLFHWLQMTSSPAVFCITRNTIIEMMLNWFRLVLIV